MSENSIFYNTTGNISQSNPLDREHIGIVIDIDDPLNLCRIRVFIPNLLGYDNDIWLGREIITLPGAVYATPKKGQRVKVWFKNQNIMDGFYGFDYVHTDSKLSNFKPGDFGYINELGNFVKFDEKNINVKYNVNIDGSLNVSGLLSSSIGYTGAFATGDGRTVTVQGGIITDIV